MKSFIILVLVLLSGSVFAAAPAPAPKPKPAPKPAPPVPGICRIDAHGNKSILDAQKRAKCTPVAKAKAKAKVAKKK